MPTSTYLELKELRFDEALREGNTSGHVDTRIRDESERCRNAVEHLLTPIEVAVRDHLTDGFMKTERPITRAFGANQLTPLSRQRPVVIGWR